MHMHDRATTQEPTEPAEPTEPTVLCSVGIPPRWK